MLYKRGRDSRRLLIKALNAGEVAVMACDTIYGFVGRAPQTGEIIRGIKGRGENKPFLQLIPGAEVLKAKGIVLPDSNILSLWPGPFTFVLPTEDGGSEAYRVPEDAYLRQMLEELGFSLYSTSVNRSGMPVMNNPAEIDAEFGGEVAIIEDSGLFEGRHPSTVVNLTVSPYKILRQGAGILPPEYLR